MTCVKIFPFELHIFENVADINSNKTILLKLRHNPLLRIQFLRCNGVLLLHQTTKRCIKTLRLAL